jgi:hypothetical protein
MEIIKIKNNRRYLSCALECSPHGAETRIRFVLPNWHKINVCVACPAIGPRPDDDIRQIPTTSSATCILSSPAITAALHSLAAAFVAYFGYRAQKYIQQRPLTVPGWAHRFSRLAEFGFVGTKYSRVAIKCGGSTRRSSTKHSVLTFCN